MEAANSSIARRVQALPGPALVVVLAGLVATGLRAARRVINALAAAQRRAQARRYLHSLNDHFLKDIGIERDQIDRLFH